MSDLKNEKFFRKYNTNELIDKDKGFLILEIFKAICIPVFFLLFITCLACGLYISAILCLLCMLANFPIKIYSKILKNEKFDKFFEKIELSNDDEDDSNDYKDSNELIDKFENEKSSWNVFKNAKKKKELKRQIKNNYKDLEKKIKEIKEKRDNRNLVVALPLIFAIIMFFEAVIAIGIQQENEQALNKELITQEVQTEVEEKLRQENEVIIENELNRLEEENKIELENKKQELEEESKKKAEEQVKKEEGVVTKTSEEVKETVTPVVVPVQEPIKEEPSVTTPKTSYVGNVNSKVFHYPSCSSVSSMKEGNKVYLTCTREEAINMGYKPCGKCHP